MPSGEYIRSAETCKRISDGVKRSFANGRVAYNKHSPMICCGCGKSFPYRNDGAKNMYCTRQCYLSNSNPSKNPEVIAKISEMLKRDDINPSKRLEVKSIISTKLKGRDAWWLKGKRISQEKKDNIRAHALKRWANKDWVSRMIRNPKGRPFGTFVESDAHIELKNKASLVLQGLGFNTTFEQPIYATKWYIVDIIGEKEGSTVVVECGVCSKKKLGHLMSTIPKVVHLPYGSDITKEVFA